MSKTTSLDNFWMPFTANRAFRQRPRMLHSAEGVYYQDQHGRPVLDGTAGLWCVNAGHGRQQIQQAVAEQIGKLDYAPSFQMGHPLAFNLAQRLAALAPDPLNHIFFCNSGSEAADTALKIALAYQQIRGLPGKSRLIGRIKGYHGTGFGGISVGGISNNRCGFGSLLPEVDHLSHTLVSGQTFSRGQPKDGAELAEELLTLIQLHGPRTLAAVIVEPVAGSAGVIVPPKGYLQRLRSICTEHDILLIFDEVITAFGRLGAGFAADAFGVTPDLLCTAKGLTNGVIPMGAVIAADPIYEAFMQGPEQMIELFHGYTYSGHPVAAAAALASLDIYQDEALFQRAASLTPHFEDAVHSLANCRHVIDIRNCGLMAAVELSPRADTPGQRAMDVLNDCFFNQNLLIRVTGDVIALSPPLIISEQEISQMAAGLAAAINATD